MRRRGERGRRPASLVPATSGIAVGIAGVGLAGMGLWARREVRATLERERIVSTPDATPASAPVVTGSAARSMAEVIRGRTLAAAGGRTYAETDPYVGTDGNGTSDAEHALVDERTGRPVEHPDHALWVQSTTLQTALMQAYIGSRLADLMIALGAAFAAVGAGLVAAAGRRR